MSRVTRVTTPAPPVSGPGSAAIAISCCHGTGSILPRMRTAHHSALSRNVAGNLHLSPNIYISIHTIQYTATVKLDATFLKFHECKTNTQNDFSPQLNFCFEIIKSY